VLAACRHVAPKELLHSAEADRSLLLKVHTAAHLDNIGLATWNALEGDAKDDMFADANTPAAARLAAGCCVVAVESVMRGDVQTAFALVRPPGHHANGCCASGFCWINNAAVAARAAQRAGAPKVAIIDWDVHHGGGTQDVFLDDPSVLYMSLHRYKKDDTKEGYFFPGTGAADEVGAGDGAGFSVNVPFTELGMTGADYMAAMDHVLLPILRDFKPDFILISAGFYAAEHDDLGEMKLNPQAYAAMTKALMEVRGNSSPGGPRVVSCLEGGYNLEQIAVCADAMVRAQLYFVGGQCAAGPACSIVKGKAKKTTPAVLQAVRDAHRSYWPAAMAASDAAFNTWKAATVPPLLPALENLALGD
jgi:acetoin utilization deacetylase AcuC-like enzyme